MEKYKVSIVGANGYAGGVLLGILANHTNINILYAVSRSNSGTRVCASFPNLANTLPDLKFSDYNAENLKQSHIVFFATPHGSAQEHTQELLDAGVKVIDLSADFRLKDISLWEHWYEQKHKAAHLVQDAVYGLVELNREAIKKANLVAVAGCYPTSILLAMAPLLLAKNLKQNLVDIKTIIADCKSGASGAGRGLKQASLFCEVAENFRPYAINGHRHSPEIEQSLSILANDEAKILFMPHLLPMKSGIESSIYLDILPEFRSLSLEEIHKIYTQAYADEKFVRILPLGDSVQTLAVKASNYCNIALARRGDKLIVMSVIDNIVKGAAGQAVQCMNLVLGLEETAGLNLIANWL